MSFDQLLVDPAQALLQQRHQAAVLVGFQPDLEVLGPVDRERIHLVQEFELVESTDVEGISLQSSFEQNPGLLFLPFPHEEKPLRDEGSGIIGVQGQHLVEENETLLVTTAHPENAREIEIDIEVAGILGEDPVHIVPVLIHVVFQVVGGRDERSKFEVGGIPLEASPHLIQGDVGQVGCEGKIGHDAACPGIGLPNREYHPGRRFRPGKPAAHHRHVGNGQEHIGVPGGQSIQFHQLFLSQLVLVLRLKEVGERDPRLQKLYAVSIGSFEEASGSLEVPLILRSPAKRQKLPGGILPPRAVCLECSRGDFPGQIVTAQATQKMSPVHLAFPGPRRLQQSNCLLQPAISCHDPCPAKNRHIPAGVPGGKPRRLPFNLLVTPGSLQDPEISSDQGAPLGSRSGLSKGGEFSPELNRIVPAPLLLGKLGLAQGGGPNRYRSEEQAGHGDPKNGPQHSRSPW